MVNTNRVEHRISEPPLKDAGMKKKSQQELKDLAVCSITFVQGSKSCSSALGFGKGVQLGEMKSNSFPIFLVLDATTKVLLISY